VILFGRIKVEATGHDSSGRRFCGLQSQMKRDGSRHYFSVFFESRETGILYRVDFRKIGGNYSFDGVHPADRGGTHGGFEIPRSWQTD
jgi:hypothetical protein